MGPYCFSQSEKRFCWSLLWPNANVQDQNTCSQSPLEHSYLLEKCLDHYPPPLGSPQGLKEKNLFSGTAVVTFIVNYCSCYMIQSYQLYNLWNIIFPYSVFLLSFLLLSLLLLLHALASRKSKGIFVVQILMHYFMVFIDVLNLPWLHLTLSLFIFITYIFWLVKCI